MAKINRILCIEFGGVLDYRKDRSPATFTANAKWIAEDRPEIGVQSTKIMLDAGKDGAFLAAKDEIQVAVEALFDALMKESGATVVYGLKEDASGEA